MAEQQKGLSVRKRELWAVLSRRGLSDPRLWDVALQPIRRRTEDCAVCSKGAGELQELGGVMQPGEWQLSRKASAVVRGEIDGTRKYLKRCY